MVVTICSQFAVSHAQDSIEFLNGTSMECKILEIRRAAKEFDIETKLGGKTLRQTYPYGKVHAVTFKGSRFELTPKTPSDAPDSSTVATRTREDVLKIIENAGRTPPNWFASAELNTPNTLELDWPLQPEKGWNNKKNVGQYIWDIVNPNEHRWQSGIKLVHHCMALHKGDRALLVRDMEKLGTMYFTLLQGYARAAFWFQQADVQMGDPAGVFLAECYWRLGNRDMALTMLKGNALPVRAVKLLGDLGEITDALRLSEAYSTSRAADEAFLAAGDALRKANRLEEAIQFYQRVLDAQTARNEDYEQRFDARAKESIEAIELFDKANVARVSDGTYRQSSTGYNGPVEVEVKVGNGKIDSLTVVAHQEKQFYAALTDTPKQILDKQGVREIDGTSGATITSQAIVNAAARALAQGAN